MNLETVFQAALEYLLAEEGGWSNRKADRGGATNYGITLSVFKGLGLEADLDGDGDVDASDLRAMSEEQARGIYRKLYWLWPALLERHPELVSRVDPRVMVKTFDTGVNCGPATASRILQSAAAEVSGTHLVLDGQLGPRSLKVILGCHPMSLLSVMCRLQHERYERIAAKDETQREFIRGWRRRALRIPEVIDATAP